MADNPTGRARGRSRGRARASGAAAPQPAPVQARPGTGPPPGMQPVAPRPPGSAPGRATRGPPRVQQPVQQLASQLKALDIGMGGNGNGGNGNGNGNGGAPVGRGSTRGRREHRVDVMRTRPENLQTKKGQTGQPITLLTNYYKVLTKTDWGLYQYRVDFSPEEDRTFVKKGLLRSQKARILEAGGEYMFDGSMMFTSHRIHGDAMELTAKRESDQVMINIKLRLVGELNPLDYQFLQFFNIIVRRCLQHLKLDLMGRNYFDPKAAVLLREYNLELWPGYITSIRQHEDHILLCCDIIHKVVVKTSVYKQMCDIMNQDRANYKQGCSNALLGKIVLTTYNNKTYRIDDINFELNPTSTFEQRNGDKISYVDYYQQHYQITIQDKNQPLLVSRPKKQDVHRGDDKPINLVPELCNMTGITDDQRKDFKFTRAMAEHTHMKPDKRIDRLMTFMRRMENTPEIQKDLNEWGLKFSKDLMQVPGRILPGEKILLGQNRDVPAGERADWSNAFRGAQMMSAVTIENWGAVYPVRDERSVKDFLGTLHRVAQPLGMRFNAPQYYPINSPRARDYVQAVDECYSRNNPQIVMVFLPSKTSDAYAAVKKKNCVDRALPTQCIAVRTASNPKSAMSVATKVAIQMNTKLGGVPWGVPVPIQNCMVVGFDVYHDSAQKGLSVGAVVASINPAFTRYFSTVSHHRSHDELSDQISQNIISACRAYQKENGNLPDRIIVYRDGVGEGQVTVVVTHEVKNVKARLDELYGEIKFKFGFIIVTKRINTRLMLPNKQNPMPGTVVDDVITLPERYDFFLVPQCANQGTISPTSYNVVFDEMQLDPDKVQRLTYKLCHLYYNWSGTVSVPAPCQYAHKLAFLVGQSLHSRPHNDLGDLLYFL